MQIFLFHENFKYLSSKNNGLINSPLHKPIKTGKVKKRKLASLFSEKKKIVYIVICSIMHLLIIGSCTFLSFFIV